VRARVPGSIYSDLRREGVLKESLLSGDNNVKYRWVSYDNWTFERKFNAPTTRPDLWMTWTLETPLIRTFSQALVRIQAPNPSVHGVDVIGHYWPAPDWLVVLKKADPGVLIVSRESQPLSGNDYQSQRLNNVGAIQPKTIIISNVGNSGDDQSSSGADSTGNPMRDVIMNVIHSQLRQAAAEANGTDGNGIPEMVFTDPEQHISGQQQQQQQQPQQQRPQQQPALTAGAGIIERVYTMPATTRLIRTEQQSDGQSDAKHFYIPFRSASKASASMWRSPLPFFRQPMGGEGHPCQHGMNGMRRQRKGRNMRRR
ncbi:unnamed protein product, partial [Medioppia subpectinata]